MRRIGLPGRDLWVLDPQLSYLSTIFGRERAIIINLEHTKAVITTSELLIPNSMDPSVVPFVQDLQSRVSGSCGAPQQEVTKSGEHDVKNKRGCSSTIRGFNGWSYEADQSATKWLGMMPEGIMFPKVMMDEQMEFLRKQISIYTTICEQLIEMHRTFTLQ